MNIKSTHHTIPAVDKTVAILTRLGESPEGMTQAELAAELGVMPSTCYRILQTLLARDWVRKQSGGRYDLALPMRHVTRKLDNRADRFRLLQPELDELARRSGLACKLSVREGDRQWALLRAESPRPVAVSGRVGATFPVAEGSVGAALLARASETERERLARLCAAELDAPETAALLEAGVAAIHQQGFCFNRGRNRWKIDALSAPVEIEENGEIAVVAALTLLGHDEDFADLPALGEGLLRQAARCGQRLMKGNA